MYRIFLAEDDHALAEAISRQLESWGNEVITVRDFRRVSAEFAEARPQLVLLDIMLPFYDGYHWCTEIRKLSSVPIVFISSASDNMNIVMAMNMGGDDFIPKPVDPMVLTAKLQALLRRTYELGEPCQALECHGGAARSLVGHARVRRSAARADKKRVPYTAHAARKPRQNGEPRAADDRAVAERLLC